MIHGDHQLEMKVPIKMPAAIDATYKPKTLIVNHAKHRYDIYCVFCQHVARVIMIAHFLQNDFLATIVQRA
ncbi:hypothetical protein [Xanthomonas phage JGB6]|nr:hypothetical protein [Xanthomonas phage JGB6]